MTTAPLAEILAALDIRGSVEAVESAVRMAYDTGKQDGIRLCDPRPPVLTPEAQAVADALSGMPRIGGELPEPECGMVARFVNRDSGPQGQMVTETPTTWAFLIDADDAHVTVLSIEDRRGNVVWIAK